MNELRQGKHKGDGQYMFSYTVPRAASRSIFGVWTMGWPYMEEKNGLCSSDMSNTKLRGAPPTV
jgi:hypothetical protein